MFALRAWALGAARHTREEAGAVGKFFGGVGALIAAIAGIIAIWQFVRPSGPPSFSGSISQYDGAASFMSFLSQHDTQRVSLHVTCIEAGSQSACNATGGPGNTGIELKLYSSAAAANCWNSSSASSCSGGALITFVTQEGASGTLSSPGAGNYTIAGNWTVRDLGSGGSTPEGDPNYELDAVS
jgi:hypothetical protein